MKTIIVFFLTILFTPVISNSQNVKFAAIGDFGFANPVELAVSNLVKSWNPEFIITQGDNNYVYGEASKIDSNIGQYYHEFISPYYGNFGAGASVNSFFPCLGNHDWYTNNAAAYLDYFTLPGNERYYDFVKSDIHFFVVDSDPHEPDGIDSNSVQAQWLKNILPLSTQKWNIVYLHHSPYCSSSYHGSYPLLQWPFKRWGATAVLSGHDHVYERLNVNNLTYIVNGLGGYPSQYTFGTPVTGSQFRYNSGYGAMLICSYDDSLTFKFYNINNDLVDNYKILPPVPNEPEFAAKVDFTSGNSPISLSIGDIDGDGKRDLVVANLNSNTVSVLLNTSASGNESFAAKVDFITGNNPRAVISGDVDGDGKRDLAITNYNSNTVSVYRNISSPGIVNFEPKVDLITGTNPRGLSIGDIDGDGKPDLVVTNESSNTVSVFRNTSVSGTVSFAAKSDFATGSNPLSVSIGDINTDGKLDLAAANYSGNSVSILSNTSASGLISFEANVDFAAGSNPYAVNIGDIDGDSKPEIAVSNNSGNTVSVFLNTSVSGNVSFAAKTDFVTGANPNNIVIGDLNGDGKSELAVSNTNSNTVSVFRNTSVLGSLSFSEKLDFGTGLNPYSVNIGDFDGDFKPDIAVANRNNNNVSVLKNLTNFPVQSYTHITLIPEGFYNQVTNKLNRKDTVTAYLRNTSSPFEVVDFSKAVIDSNTFTGNFNFANTLNGTYYIVIKHRNSIETWSKSGGEVFINGHTQNFDFTTADSQSYGNNMIQVGSKYCNYSGDVNQDGLVDMSDVSLIDNDVYSTEEGYDVTDLNGDEFVDLSDIVIADNNAFHYVSVMRP